MTEKPRFIYKPLSITQDKRLTPIEQDYLCLIAQLSRRDEGCTASNRFFADYFGVKRQTAVGVIAGLRRKEFISTTETKRGGRTEQRTIRMIDPDSRKSLLSDSRKLQSGIAGNSDCDSRSFHKHKTKGKQRGKNGLAPLSVEEIPGGIPEADEAAILRALGYTAESEVL